MKQAPVRVLQVLKGLGLGGTEKAAQLLALHLDKQAYSVEVFSFADGPRKEQLLQGHIPVHINNDLFTFLVREKPALIHVHRAGWPEPELLRPVLAYKTYCRRQACRPPVVVETNVFGRHDPSPEAKAVDLGLFVSHFCAERYCREYGEDVYNWEVLYNPVDVDLFGKMARKRGAGGLVLGRLSRPDPGKWSSLALDMLPLLKLMVPDFRMRIVGATEEAIRFFSEYGLTDRVDLLPPLETDTEIAQYFNTINLLAHANDTGETFGLVIAEAMAAGLPVITHPCPYPKDNAQLELVEDGRTGLVASSPEEYCQAVRWLFSHPEKAAAMGLAGQEKARRLFRVQGIVNRLSNIYQALLNKSVLATVK